MQQSPNTYAYVHPSCTHTRIRTRTHRLADQRRQSKTIEKNLNPTWNETMTLRVTDRMEPLQAWLESISPFARSHPFALPLFLSLLDLPFRF